MWNRAVVNVAEWSWRICQWPWGRMGSDTTALLYRLINAEVKHFLGYCTASWESFIEKAWIMCNSRGGSDGPEVEQLTQTIHPFIQLSIHSSIHESIHSYLCLSPGYCRDPLSRVCPLMNQHQHQDLDRQALFLLSKRETVSKQAGRQAERKQNRGLIVLVAAAPARKIKGVSINPGRSPVLSRTRTRTIENRSEGRKTEMGGGGWKRRGKARGGVGGWVGEF